MSAYIRDLQDKKGNTVYPTTVLSAVFMPDKITTVYDEIQRLNDGSSVTEFTSDGKIKKTLSDGKVVTTEFSGNSITETCRYPSSAGGKIYYTKTTTFQNDGKIKTDVVYTKEGV